MSHCIIQTEKSAFATCESDMPLPDMAVVWREVLLELNISVNEEQAEAWISNGPQDKQAVKNIIP